MTANMIETGSYNGILGANFGLENMLHVFQYQSLESQLNTIQFVQELEDPPETLHTPWGTWRHYRDALHSIDERFDTEHMIRKSRPAEDILHEAHYVPTIGDPVHKKESYGMSVEYNDVQLEVYNSKINLEYFAEEEPEVEIQDESTGISMNAETEDAPIDLEGRDIEERPEEPNPNDRLQDRAQKKNFDLKSEEKLTKNLRDVLNLVLKVNVFKWYYPVL